MVLVDKRAALQEIEKIPIVCHICEEHVELQSPNDTVRDSLIQASYIRAFQEEIVLLQRTQALFDRFPGSRHPKKIHHLYVKQSERLDVCPDAEFAEALVNDPELSVFLQGGFLLPARLASITEACSRWEAELDDAPIRCAACTQGHYLIDAELFDNLINGSQELARHP